MVNVVDMVNKVYVYAMFDTCGWEHSGVVIADKSIDLQELQDTISYGRAVADTVRGDADEEDRLEDIIVENFDDCWGDNEFINKVLDMKYGNGVVWVETLEAQLEW